MQQLTDSQLWDHLRPYVIRHVSDIVAGAASSANWAASPVTAHDLGGPDHYGTLRLAQAPWAFATDGSRAITGNVTVASGVTIDGIDISAHAADPNAHHYRSHSITSTSDHTVTGSAFQVLGATATNTLGMLTPLADVSGATKEALLKSTSAGYLTTVRVTTTDQVSTPLLTATGNLTIDPGTDVLFPQAQIVRSDNFTAGYPIVGWQIGQHLASATLNAMQIHSLTLDELRTRVFVADEVRVDRGEEFVTKSYGIVAADFVTPAALNGTVTIYFDDSPAVNGAIFSSGDYILFRIFDDSSGFSITEIWGTVTSYADQSNDQQSWTFTLKYGPTSTTVRRGMVAWDWGVTGQGYIHSSVIDTSGAPYIDIRHWTGSGGPYPTASPSPTFTTDVRIGNLIASLDNDLSPTGWGLYASNAYLRGVLVAANLLINDGEIRVTLESAAGPTYAFHFDRDTDQERFAGLYAEWTTDVGEDWDYSHYIGLAALGDDTFNTVRLDAPSSGTGVGRIVLDAGDVLEADRPHIELRYDPNSNLSYIALHAVDVQVQGAIEIIGHMIPSATSTYDLGSASKTWRKVYVDEIIATTITGEEALGGQTWQYDDGDMYVKSSSSGTRTLYVSNPGTGTMNLDVDGNITVGGTVDGVDIAALGSAYSAHIASANAHHNQAHVFATESGLGSDHTVSGLTTGYYIRATGATTAAFAAIVDGDLPSTIVRTSRNLATGNGLTGGGTLESNRTFDLADGVAGDGLSISSKVMAIELSATSGLELTGSSPAKTLQLADAVAGDGITIVNKVLSVELSATSGLELTGSSPAKTLQLADAVAGAGMTMTSKVLNIIATANGGLTVNANDVGLDWGTPTISTIYPDDVAAAGASANPARGDHKHAVTTAAPGANSVSLAASAEGGGTAFARADHTHQLDVSIAPTWTGAHTFQANMVARHIRPEATDTYDLGTATYWWRQQYVSQINAVVFAESTIQLLGGWLYIPKDAGTFAAQVEAAATQINFGKAMTTGHFVLVKSHDSGIIKTEYILVGALVSGTTYNVTRDLAGAHVTDPVWAQGTPFAVLGASGAGRIELNAYDTPRISLISQGATYNAQSELLRIGDLNGGWGYATETYGVAIGERAAAKVNLTLDAGYGFRLFLNATQLAQWDSAGNISIGDTANEHVYITATGLQMRDGTSVYTDITGGTVTLGLTSSGEYVDISATNGLRIYGGGLLAGQWTNAGKAIFGQVTNSRTRIEIDPLNGISIISRSAGGVDTTAISLTNAGAASFTGAITAASGSITGTLAISGSGKITAGSTTVDTTGISLTSPTSWFSNDGYKFLTSTTIHSGIWVLNPGATDMYLRLLVNNVPGVYGTPVYGDRNATIEITSSAVATKIATTIISAYNLSGANAFINMQAGNATSTIAFSADTSITFNIAPKVGANTIWHAGNDGAASGLDADLVDGYFGRNGSNYWQVDNWIQISGATGLYAPASGAGTHWRPTDRSYGSWEMEGAKGGYVGLVLENTRLTTLMFDTSGNGGLYEQGTTPIWTLFYNGTDWFVNSSSGNKVWHAGNDGAGSLLDADKLDGQEGSYYLTATNINAGTLADARLPATMATKTINGLTMQSGGVTVATVQAGGLRIETTATDPYIYVQEQDNGASYGGRVVIGRNTNASTPAAGAIEWMNRNGSWLFLWPDASGNIRTGSSANTSANDTTGTVVGTQTSNLAYKQIVAIPQPGDGYAAIAAAANAVRDFTYLDGRWLNRRLDGPKIQRGIVTNYAPTFGLDYHPDYPDGKVLDEVSLLGNLVLATAFLGIRTESQAERIARLENRVAQLERQLAQRTL